MNDNLERLYKGYLANSLSAEELQEFLTSLHDPENERLVSQWMDGTWSEMYNVARQQQAPLVPIYRPTRLRGVSGTGPRVIRTYWKWIAAACILLAIAVVGVVTNNRKGITPPPVATTHDVPAPTNTRAVITLANGSKVYLDSAGNGTIAQENNVNVIKNADCGIQYLSSSGGTNSQQLTANSLAYNTLFNPRGSKVISLTLSDGTKVWLNSESSLRYPASFAPSALSREVEITGEAYFEVKHNAKQPFKVHLPNGSMVEDIGTSFNINAYTDEEAIKTTLIEGSVRLMSPAGGGDLRNSPNRERPGVDHGIRLNPGQQAVLSPNSQFQITNSVNLEEVLAWKNGQFNLRSTSIGVLLRQIARWYDVDVVYQGPVPENKFGGSLSRELNLSTVLKALQQSGIDVKLQGRKIIVK